jgi:hypothetical protein
MRHTVTPDRVAAAPTIAYKPGIMPVLKKYIQSQDLEERSINKLTIALLSTRTEKSTEPRFLILHPLNPDAKNAARAGTNSQGRNENTAREFKSECHNR